MVKANTNVTDDFEIGEMTVFLQNQTFYESDFWTKRNIL